ncbi:murein hydrolase activator EnvC family protein [Candidatus Solincola sp.]|nr:peptidoglycan DD-metalloendopeptidase family protein [Actinomycetota bacterium]MDI7251926.1 peptidoglycan DD-metalloendopeptidase family protein [Actinomycetota bacterium]
MKARAWRAAAVALLVCMLFAALPLPTCPSATLQEKQAEAERVRRQLEALKAESQRLAQEYNAALDAYEAIRAEVESNRRELERAQRDYKRARTILNQRLRSIYMSGDVNSMEVLLESTTLDDFLTRYDYFSFIGRRDYQVFDEVRRLREEITRRQHALEEKEALQMQTVATLNAKRQAMEASIQEQQKYLESVNKEILQLLAQEGYYGTPRSTPIGNFIFPVQGPCSFSNDWHAPRTGHLHQGNDIFAPAGTPCVACVSGTVHQGEGKNAGLYVRLVGDDGNVYYYMHLQRFGATGHVTAGTVIGYVGDTGNAKGGPPHLHFEIHPGGGPAINPYPILLAAYR